MLTFDLFHWKNKKKKKIFFIEKTQEGKEEREGQLTNYLTIYNQKKRNIIK